MNNSIVELLHEKIIFIALLLNSFTTFAFECPKTQREAMALKDYHTVMLEEDIKAIERLNSSITPENRDAVMEEVNYILDTQLRPRQLFLAKLGMCRYDIPEMPDREQRCDEVARELKYLKVQSLVIKDRLMEILLSLPEGQNPYDNAEYRELADKKQYYDSRIAELSVQC